MLVFRCSVCDGTDVNSKCWANPNNDEIHDYISDELEDNWCNICDEHVQLIVEDDSILPPNTL